VVESVEIDLDMAAATGDGTARKLFKAMEEFHTYIDRNRAFIPNDGERYHIPSDLVVDRRTAYVEAVQPLISR
jgi:hypothetical protein